MAQKRSSRSARSTRPPHGSRERSDRRGANAPAPTPLAAPKGVLEPGLYVIATPIGNLGDITFRAVETLKAVDALASEDTRVSAKLLSHLGIDKPHPTFSCHEHNEARTVGRIRSLIDEGRAVGLVSDAGLPGISDPGYRVISTLLDEGVKVEVLPGPNAATMALVASGLPTSSFTFLGFASRKSGKRKKMLEAEREAEHTLIIYESPHRIGALLADALEVLGDRQAVVALELTKMFERYHRGPLSQLVEEFAEDKPKGEITVLIEGVRRKSKHDEDDD
ncbi:16S rRNA (cytidine(1402)-2'-O)-methyltransferase [Magnetovibrio sp.]|uniref:16S rRNA (cytidine(1402)-2'-O)-methyltransferase n=1 Tax=Magnetovibrio sp. TaxID=2024836 RepID=UPI002F95EC38